MILLAKAALGIGGTLAVAGAYTFHQGLLRIDVDEYRAGGEHVHLWFPAAAIPMAMHLVPAEHMHLHCASQQAQDALPVVRAFVKELRKYPNMEFVDVEDGQEHVQVRTHDGKLQIDVVAPDENVHILCPLSTIEDVTSQLVENAPGA
jgi:hypothetical protein